MKKLLLLFGAAVLTLTSCTDAEETTTPKLLKTKTIDGDVFTLTYNGSKIVSTQGSTSAETYTYTGELITGSTFDFRNTFGNIQYNFDKGKLISSLVKSNGGSGTTLSNSGSSTFTYNADGTITIQEYDYEDGAAALSRSRNLTFQNGNLIKEERFNASGQKNGSSTYEYDTEINPMRKILGSDKWLTAEWGSVNNVVKSIETYGSDSNLTTYEKTSVYAYASDGYPLTRTTTTVRTAGTDSPETTTSTTQYGY